jgi:hypothetical protein
MVASKVVDAINHAPSHLNDFALPGVTMAMYDTILDAGACGTEVLSREGGKEHFCSNLLLRACFGLQRMLGRLMT